MQYHLFSKNQPENLAFLERMRTLLDEYEARAMVGEMGESHHAIRMMGEYTTGGGCISATRSRCWATVSPPRTSAARSRSSLPGRRGAGRPGRSRTTTCCGTSPAGRSTGSGREPLAKLAGALLLSLEGSICIYQGEELGQTETELELFELTDPQGIRFWPEPIGRDGCRTPMVWDGGKPERGFSTGQPWLPVKEPQAARHVAGQTGDPKSVLEFYRAMLRLRRETEELRPGRTVFFDVAEPVLAFTRGGTVLCVFNLSPETHAGALEGGGAVALAQAAEREGERLVLHPNGFAIMEATKATSVDMLKKSGVRAPPRAPSIAWKRLMARCGRGGRDIAVEGIGLFHARSPRGIRAELPRPGCPTWNCRRSKEIDSTIVVGPEQQRSAAVDENSRNVPCIKSSAKDVDENRTRSNSRRSQQTLRVAVPAPLQLRHRRANLATRATGAAASIVEAGRRPASFQTLSKANPLPAGVTMSRQRTDTSANAPIELPHQNAPAP